MCLSRCFLLQWVEILHATWVCVRVYESLALAWAAGPFAFDPRRMENEQYRLRSSVGKYFLDVLTAGFCFRLRLGGEKELACLTRQKVRKITGNGDNQSLTR